MDSSQQTITIPVERLQKIIQVLSYASVEAFTEAQVLLGTETEDDFGEVEGVLRVFLQELQNSQQLQLKQQQQQKLIEAQQIAIKDLSTPIIDLWDDIITLPIVGIVDSQRALEMTERLLQRVVEKGSRCIIIDITGVNVVDTMTADHFVKMVKAVRYLGSYCVVTGISPEIAQTLVLSGVEMGNVKTLRSLKEGLKDCFHYLRQSHQDKR
jgi:rsbT co-antagonist protein RsbR